MSYKHSFIKSVKYELDVRTISPLSIKDDDSIKRDFLTGKFIIPGSSLTGAFRNYYENYIIKNQENNLLFSDEIGKMNRLYCYDSIQTTESKNIGSRPGVMIDMDTLVSHSGNKFERKFVQEGSEFLIVLELHQYEESFDFEEAEKQLEQLIIAFSNKDISLGGYKQIGFGLFEVKDIHKIYTDFTSYHDLMKYMLRNKVKESVKEQLLEQKVSSNKIKFIIEATTETPILIKDGVVRNHEYPDGMNIVNVDGQYIIPGSSLKGVIRNRIQRIVNSFDELDQLLVDDIFGKAENKESGGHSSRLLCMDTIIGEPKTQVYNKIKIDHFTGGVMQGALMNEEVIMGKVKIALTLNRSYYDIKLDDSGNKVAYQEVGLILLALQELCKGELSLGSGFAVGRGFLKGSKLLLEAGKTYTYEFNNSDSEVEKVFDTYVKALWKEEA
jgi:CRISPR/Cas system CSM-associated protein Csm3 (group 7 of RAMP superfamily)